MLQGQHDGVIMLECGSVPRRAASTRLQPEGAAVNVRRVRQVGVWSSVVLVLSVHAQAAKYPLIDFQQLRGIVAYDVLQDSSGSIWLATDQGLWRWSNDGFVSELQRFPLGP